MKFRILLELLVNIAIAGEKSNDTDCMAVHKQEFIVIKKVGREDAKVYLFSCDVRGNVPVGYYSIGRLNLDEFCRQ